MATNSSEQVADSNEVLLRYRPGLLSNERRS